MKVGSDADPDMLVKSVIEDLQGLAPRTDGTDSRTEEEVWSQVRDRLLKAAYETRPHCIRCGECCSNGSPTLLAEDMILFRDDVLKPTDIVTIRRGEPVYSNREEKADTAQDEMLKIKEAAGEKTCIFYEKWIRAAKSTIHVPAVPQAGNAGTPAYSRRLPTVRGLREKRCWKPLRRCGS